MKEYLKKAIEEGKAFDAYASPEKAKKLIEERIGFMRDVFDDVDEKVKDLVNLFREHGVIFYGDLDVTLDKFILRNLPEYVEGKIAKALKK